MTPRQLDRAVNTALARILPPMVRSLRDDLVAELRQVLAAGGASEPQPKAPEGAPPRHASAESPWTVGAGAGRRLTPAGLQQLKKLADEGTLAKDIAAQLGVSKRAVNLHLEGTEAGSAHSTRAKPAELVAQAKALFDEGKGTAAIARLLKLPKTTVQGWKTRHGWEREGNPQEAPAAKTVVVVPAAEVPAPAQPPAPDLSALTPKQDRSEGWQSAIERFSNAVAKKRAEAAPPAPLPAKAKPEPQVITTTAKDVRAWLIASFKAGGLTQLQASDRVGFMTHDQVLTEANQRRLRAGHPPFAFLGTKVPA